MPRPTHFEIPAEDVHRAVKFFGDVFGWKSSEFGENSGYFLTSTGNDEDHGIDGAIMQRKHPEQPLTNSILVDSIDEYAPKIAQAGGQIVVPKMVIPSAGYLAYFKDTEGNIHGLWQEDTSAA
jgi:predicted enzyme related to lactoylglutathione lyase